MEARHGRWSTAMMSWLVSLVLHALLMIALGYVAGQQMLGMRGVAFDSLIGDPAGTLVAGFSNSSGDMRRGDRYFDDERPAGEEATVDSSAPAGKSDVHDMEHAVGASLAAIASGAPPVDAMSALPRGLVAAEFAGGSTGSPWGTSGAGDLLNGPHRPGSRRGQFARTHVYGVAAEGNTFVYVFDRSSSMSSGGNNLFASAKRELLASLDDLSEESRFHIIFYNEKPTSMDLGRGFSGLVFADARAKERARGFVEGILAAGGTRHFAAMKQALRLRPDVIFFLTDADEPELSDGQMSEIRSLNGGRTTINTIEFGDRPQPRANNFLSRIARENGGQYLYVDVTQPSAAQ
ncbi:MAG TPA: hypothetical protein VG826_21505 [Pirellulales bacterium]|nr:hypothetical protein [Pirellulales bacterium]